MYLMALDFSVYSERAHILATSKYVHLRTMKYQRVDKTWLKGKNGDFFFCKKSGKYLGNTISISGLELNAKCRMLNGTFAELDI